MQNLKYDIDELIYKKLETYYMNAKRPCGCQGQGMVESRIRAWEEQTQSTEYRSDRQQDPTCRHELYSVSSDKP